MTSLRHMISARTGQNIARCIGCQYCDVEAEDKDIPLGALIYMAVLDDEACLESRTLWSEEVLQKAPRACAEGLNLKQIIIALREEARQRSAWS